MTEEDLKSLVKLEGPKSLVKSEDANFPATEEDKKWVLHWAKEIHKDRFRETIQKDKKYISTGFGGALGLGCAGALYNVFVRDAIKSPDPTHSVKPKLHGWDLWWDGLVYVALFAAAIMGMLFYEGCWRASRSLLFWKENPWIPILYCGWLATIVLISVGIVILFVIGVTN